MSKTVEQNTDLEVFKAILADYKQLIDADIKAYAKDLQGSTLKQFGSEARLATDAYLSILARGGKRIRGALVLLGYEMCGGTDTKMILQAARAIEIMHAYILIIDDIQDRSPVRRGGPTAHTMLADYHREHRLADGPDHFGLSLALMGALSGAHDAELILAGLDVDETLRLKALRTMNSTMIVTAHGQTNDIMNEVVADVTQAQVERVLEWKTAHYSFLNPLRIGMVLAGADAKTTDAITTYAMHTGKAFQITDDILGVFGSEFESGKSPMDDIREGKRTVLSVYALEHTSPGDKNFLIQMLGNHRLSPAGFARCKDILVDCGALDYAHKQAQKHIKLALAALDKEQGRWNAEGTKFLRGLTQYLATRKS